MVDTSYKVMNLAQIKKDDESESVAKINIIDAF